MYLSISALVCSTRSIIEYQKMPLSYSVQGQEYKIPYGVCEGSMSSLAT